MAKALSTVITNQLTNKDVKIKLIFKVNSVDYTDYLMEWSVEANKTFGSTAAVFTLNNDDGYFGEVGAAKIEVGDVVELIQQYGGDSNQFTKFYGIVNQRAIAKSANVRTITLQCLDYISILQFWDVDYVAEATKLEVTEEVLTPNYLPAPNDNMAQLFDMAHESIAPTPLPILAIRDKSTDERDPRYDGFEVYYDVGQVKLGSPLNSRYNYDLLAVKYYYYPVGLYVEDILEDLLSLPNGYDGYLFGETSAANVVTNHLTTNFVAEEGRSYDTLSPNLTASTITIRTDLTQAYDSDISGANPAVLHVTDTSGFPTSGSATVNGDAFTWTGKTSTTLTGIPATGPYALKNHPIGSYVKYENTYPIGQVWYLSYNNLTTVLAQGHFTLGGKTLQYFDQRYGRIILNSPASIGATITCNTNYSFKTLQATGIELNKISFRSRDIENLFEAVKKLKSYVAPNYIIRTQGDSKIWASYLQQKTTQDYTLQLVTNLTYLEDQDLYTRVVMYCKNKAPVNIMFNDGIEFVTTGNSYTGMANQMELTQTREEDAYWVYTTSISGVGKIRLDTIVPKVYVDGIPIDNTAHQQTLVPITVEVTTRTETTTGGK